ncbi:MAG: alpha-L-fucosidase [Dehalococcoidia bacterium]
MRYEPTRDSVRKHRVPEWYHDAKFGIFIHWGPFSIPAYAPLGHGTVNDLLAKEGQRSFFRNIPYSEWYINSIRIPGSPAFEHHRRTYGDDASYFDFAEQFKQACKGWQPEPWADLFQSAGARYCVLVTKHMDGFLMWPSGVPNYAHAGYQMEHDIVGDLAAAVRDRGMRFGCYYSSALDQSFTSSALTDIAGLLSEGGPIDRRYARYQAAHWRELIDRYHPSILWGDIAYPPSTNLFGLFAYFYNRTPEGVVNDRWGQLPRWLHRLVRTRPGRALLNAYATRILRKGTALDLRPPHSDFRTPEFAVMEDIRPEKWEMCRGMGNGFGFNREETDDDYIRLPDLIHMLIDIVSKNGNLLLNVGPRADGTIPEVQAGLLRGLGAWLATFGGGIYGTRPWRRAEGTTASGGRVRFTRRSSAEGETLHVFLLDPPQDTNVTIRDLRAREGTVARDLATGRPVDYRQDGNDLTLGPVDLPLDTAAHAFALTPG